MTEVKHCLAGEQGCVVEFGNEVCPQINRQVKVLTDELVRQNITGILEVVPTYRSVFIHFDPLVLSRQKLKIMIDKLLTIDHSNELQSQKSMLVHIPVCYGGEFGPDLEFVAKSNNLTTQDVINIHSSKRYLVYMIGFTPGFPYLGGMSEQIATPRLTTPRILIPAGTVGIAGQQTGLYPVASPGGWQLIGRTPVKVFNLAIKRPFLFSAGDYLKFDAVSKDEYVHLATEIEAEKYIPVIEYICLQDGGEV